MNTEQAVRRIRTILSGRLWGGSGDPVFARDSVRVSLGPAESLSDQIRLPAAFVAAGSGTADPQRPGLITRTINVVVATYVPGDVWGERPLIGANRTGATGIQSRGLYEIETELFAAIGQIDASQQFRIGLKFASATEGEIDADTGYHVFGRYGFEAYLTDKRQHAEPRALALSESGGTVTIDWDAPDDTTNLVSYVVRRIAGTIPVAFPDEGTDVSWSTGTSTTDTPGSGTWTYSVFATYDDEGGSFVGAYSDCAYATITF